MSRKQQITRAGAIKEMAKRGILIEKMRKLIETYGEQLPFLFKIEFDTAIENYLKRNDSTSSNRQWRIDKQKKGRTNG